MAKKIDARKAAIVGCGFVGAATAFALVQSRLFSELVLIDADFDKADGEALDIAHGIPFTGQTKIFAGQYRDLSDASVAIVTAGGNQKPGETRLDLVEKNVGILKSVIPEIIRQGFDGILLIVSNPVDILTDVAVKLSGLPESRVIGSGTLLDTARLKYALSERLRVDSRSIHSFVIGEHGDSEIVAWSSANVSGIPLHDFCEMRGYFDHDAAMREIAEDVRHRRNCPQLPGDFGGRGHRNACADSAVRGGSGKAERFGKHAEGHPSDTPLTAGHPASTLPAAKRFSNALPVEGYPPGRTGTFLPPAAGTPPSARFEGKNRARCKKRSAPCLNGTQSIPIW